MQREQGVGFEKKTLPILLREDSLSWTTVQSVKFMFWIGCSITLFSTWIVGLFVGWTWVNLSPSHCILFIQRPLIAALVICSNSKCPFVILETLLPDDLSSPLAVCSGCLMLRYFFPKNLSSLFVPQNCNSLDTSSFQFHTFLDLLKTTIILLVL